MTQATETKEREERSNYRWSRTADGRRAVGRGDAEEANRPYFVRQVGRNIRKAAAGLDVRNVEWSSNRVLVRPGPSLDWPELRERLRRVFGIANFSLCEALPWDVDVIRARVLQIASERSFETFRITVKRSDKRFPATSQELEIDFGEAVRQQSGARVDLTHYEADFRIEIQPGAAYVHTERIDGAAGLPVGTAGRVVALLSGGIDSPVAAWKMMSRGCQVSFVHFMSFPYLDASSRDKAIALARRLTPWQYQSRLHVVSFGDIQHAIVASCPPPLRVVLYRRFMLRIAEAIAQREGAEVLVQARVWGRSRRRRCRTWRRSMRRYRCRCCDRSWAATSTRSFARRRRWARSRRRSSRTRTAARCLCRSTRRRGARSRRLTKPRLRWTSGAGEEVFLA